MPKSTTYVDQTRKKMMETIKKIKENLPKYTYAYLAEIQFEYQISSTCAYTRDLLFFYKFLQKSNPLCTNLETHEISLDILNQLSYEDIVEYKNYMRDTINSKQSSRNSSGTSTINRRLSSLRGFYAYLQDHNYIQNNPTVITAIRKKKKVRKELETLERHEVKALLYNTEVGNFKNARQKKCCEKEKYRDIAIITLLLHTGIRVSECIGLDLEDLHFKEINPYIHVTRKGGFNSTIYVEQNVITAITDYLTYERPRYTSKETTDEQALFLSNQKTRLTVRSVERIVKKYGETTFLNDKKVTPHTLRRSYGTELLAKTGNIKLVSDNLGHSDIKTTSTFYTKTIKENKLEAANIQLYENDYLTYN